jgi:hypothetical protein
MPVSLYHIPARCGENLLVVGYRSKRVIELEVCIENEMFENTIN